MLKYSKLITFVLIPFSLLIGCTKKSLNSDDLKSSSITDSKITEIETENNSSEDIKDLTEPSSSETYVEKTEENTVDTSLDKEPNTD